MNDENRKQVIALVLVLALLAGALYYSFNSVPGSSPNPKAAAAAADGGDSSEGGNVVPFESVFQDVEVDIDQLIQNIEPFEFIYKDVRIARNPAQPVVQVDGIEGKTWPQAPPTTGDESLVFLAEQKRVTGIIWDAISPLAVIDGEVVSEGHEFVVTDTNKTIVVKTIAEDFVVLSIPSEDLDVTKDLVEVDEG